mgnify:CR=1 FL=1
MNRLAALEQIITLGGDLNNAYSALLSHGIDGNAEVFIVTPAMLDHALTQYLQGHISADDLGDWADFIECRDDVDYSQIEGFIYALTNPDLMGEITKATMTRMQILL